MTLCPFQARIFVLLALWAVTARAGETLAIPDFENLTGKSSLQFIGRVLADALGQPLAEHHQFSLAERQKLQDVFKEKSLAASGALGDSAATQPLRLLQADELVLGSFSGSAEALQVQVRTVRLSDGAQLGSLAASGRLEDVVAGMGATADQLEALLHGHPFGSLELITEPTGLELRIDGRPSGRTPFRSEHVTVGRHELTLSRAGRELWKDTLPIDAGKRLLKRLEIDDPRERDGFWLSFGGGAVFPTTTARSLGMGPNFLAALQYRHSCLDFGIRGSGSSKSSRTESFPIPYGTGNETRTLRTGTAAGTLLWHPPRLGPLEIGLGGEAGGLWSRDEHPSWRTDLAATSTEHIALAAGPLCDLSFGNRTLLLALEGGCPVTLTSWKRERIVRQDLFPIGSGSNLVTTQDEKPLWLPSVSLVLKVHL